MLQDSFFSHWIFKKIPCIAVFEWVLRCPNSNLIIVYCMEWIIFWTSAGQKYSLCRSLRLVSLPTWSVVAQLVVAVNIIWEAWVRIPSDPGFLLAFSAVSFIEAYLRGLCLHFFYCVLSYRPVSSLGTNQRRKFLPDCICKYGMRTPSRLTISLVSKFLKKVSHS